MGKIRALGDLACLRSSLRSSFQLPHPSQMSQQEATESESFPAEVLLRVFRNLDSKDMVLVSRTNHQWLEIINEHRTLWRRLVLDLDKTGGQCSILELFDRKSDHSLREVSIQSIGEDQESVISDILLRSRQTLSSLRLDVGDPYGRLSESTRALSDLSFRLSNLVEFKLFEVEPTRGSFGRPNVRVRIQNEDQVAPKLRVLWIWKCDELFTNHLGLLRNLTSLVLYQHLENLEMWRVLEGPAHSLKHLDIQIHEFDEDQELPTLNFLNLEVLELMSYGYYPNWLSIPSTSTFISKQYHVPRCLPSINELWVDSLMKWEENLAGKCPILNTLRLSFDKKVIAQIKRILPLLKKRIQNVEEGLEVDGVAMVRIERLIVPLRFLKAELISELRELVDQVVDLQTVPRLIDVSV